MANPAFVAVGSAAQTLSATVAPGAPASAGSPDFQLVVINDATNSETITATPSGWSLLASTAVSSPTTPDRGGSQLVWLYTSTTAGTGAASWTKSGTRRQQSIRCAYSNPNGLLTPASPNVTSAAQTHSIPATTTTTDNAVVIGVAAVDSAASVQITAPSGWNTRFSAVYGSSTEWVSITVADIVVPTAGAVSGDFTTTVIEEVAVWALVLDGTAAAASGPPPGNFFPFIGAG